MGKVDTDLRPHNMVLSNYEGKTSHILGLIQVSLSVGSIVRPTLFMVIGPKVNYNLLLGREWIHRIMVVPSILHLRLSIWWGDGIVENMEVDHGYFTVDVKMVNKRNFDEALTTIPPCYPEDATFRPHPNTTSVLTLHPTHDFIWDDEDHDHDA